MRATIRAIERKYNGITLAILLSGLFVAMVIAVAKLMPFGVDWSVHFRPAVMAVLAGQSPYNVPGFYNPPWALLPLLPLGLLPEAWGRGVLLLISLVVFFLVALRMRATKTALLLYMFNPVLLYSLHNGNLDWLVTIGLVLRPQIGLFLVLLKPQLGAAIAIYWLIEAWRKGGWRKVARTFGPVILAFVGSVALFGPWFLTADTRIDQDWNVMAHLWPYSVAPAAILFYFAVKRQQVRWAIVGAPLFSPYAIFHSFCIPMVALVDRPRVLAVVVGICWLFFAAVGGFSQASWP